MGKSGEADGRALSQSYARERERGRDREREKESGGGREGAYRYELVGPRVSTAYRYLQGITDTRA